MKKIVGLICILLMTSVCLSDEQNSYVVKKTPKKNPKITAQNCYETMLSEMIWASHINTSMGQNQLHALSYIDETLLEDADQKELQKFLQEEQEYLKELEQFAQVQKKRRAFHEEFKANMLIKKKKK